VVVAGEILEHVADPPALVAEVCRVLRPGGVVVVDTIARTRMARLAAVTIAERMPGGPPPGIHDPALFVDRDQLRAAFAKNGVVLHVRGLFPHPVDYVRWLLGQRRDVRLVRVPATGVLFSGMGVKIT
jgi:2-polyprenyl-6-hydroxyphenyl methylase/3-demethylubiquinone-9 3-methyltransferase